MSTITEYFLLRDALLLAAKVPAEERAETASLLALGRQRAEAAEALWANGHSAEALRLAVDALARTIEALPKLATVAQGAEDWQEVLRKRRVAAEALRLLAESEVKAREAQLPKLDAAVTTKDGELFQRTLAARAKIDRAVADAALSPRALRWTRFTRLATVLASVAIFALGFYLLLRTPHGAAARASDVFAAQFDAPRVIDSDPATEWLLPDGATGWVEVSYSPPRHVTRVDLRNAMNPPYQDRGTNAYRLEFYRGEERVQSVEGAFPDPAQADAHHDVDVPDVDRVRFVALGHHRLGAGLAELTVNP
jgi:hypothetical protein